MVQKLLSLLFILCFLSFVERLCSFRSKELLKADNLSTKDTSKRTQPLYKGHKTAAFVLSPK